MEPLVADLPPEERARIEDSVIANTGIAPKPVADSLRAGLLSADPASRVAAARRAERMLNIEPPIHFDRDGIRTGEFDALRPYIDLPLSDARKIELAERDMETKPFDGSPPRMETKPFDGSPLDSVPLSAKKEETPAENRDAESLPPEDGEPAKGDGGTGDAAPEIDPERREELEDRLSDPEMRAALREKLLADLQAEAERTDMPPGELLARQQEIRDAVPADPSKGTQVAIAPAFAVGAAAISPQALASALAVIGLGGLVKGDTNDAGNTTEDGISKRTEEDDDDGGGRGRGRPDESGESGGVSASDPGGDPPEESPRGKKARDSSKNERHGDDGRALEKAKKQLDDLERRIENAPNKKSRKRLKITKKRVKKSAKQKQHGNEHSNTGKR